MSNISISIHPCFRGLPKIVAYSTLTMGAPLRLEISDGEDNRQGEVTIFTGNHAMTEALLSAINDVADRFSRPIEYLQAAE